MTRKPWMDTLRGHRFTRCAAVIRAFLRLLSTPRPNPEPATPRHVPATQDRHWREKRTYAETHRRLAAELGVKWEPRG